ncbi:acylglycerol kinase family protein [Clostridium sp. OF09-36]|uniref:acylglycerol kinase family protein n=1 Tax=Clostridium sp. OF09-36 TaxID=2292310 RepID=UPI00325B504D
MSKSKQMLLIINPRSGREKIRLKLLDILDTYTGAGYQVQVYVTQKALDARAAVLKYGARKDLIVCSGGDGTLNEVISGMMELPKPVMLGYIPAGSTNDFASSLRLPSRCSRLRSMRHAVFPMRSTSDAFAKTGILSMWQASGLLQRCPI